MTIKHLLTKEQENFIKRHKIPYDLLFDAGGEAMTEEMKQGMTKANKAFVYNTENCDKDPNHTLKSIDGDCVQCDASKIPSILGEYQTAYIYLAGSIKANWIKVGLAKDIRNRIKTMNNSSSMYGGHNDWEILFYAKTTSSGKIERMIHERLNSNKISAQYIKSFKLQKAADLYQCSYQKAKGEISAIQDEEKFEFTQVNEKSHLISEYQFRNLTVK